MTLRIVRGLALAALTCLGLGAQAQHAPWPDKSVRIVLPGPPGSSPDRITRLLSERLTQKWGQTVVVDNRPGATTRIGAEVVAHAAPDGYTLLSTFLSHGIVRLLYPDTPYDPIADFTPVVQYVDAETVLVVRGDSPYQTLKQLIDDVKKRGRPLQIGNYGTGSSFHFYSLLLGQGAGIDVLPVPYKGEALSLAALLGGHIEASFNSVGTALPHLREGKIRALGLGSPQRSKAVPDVPTFPEMGLPRLLTTGWFGLLAPAGTPKPIVAKIHDDIEAILREPETVKWLRDQGLEPAYGSTEDFGKVLVSERDRWAQLIKEFKVSVE